MAEYAESRKKGAISLKSVPASDSLILLPLFFRCYRLLSYALVSPGVLEHLYKYSVMQAPDRNWVVDNDYFSIPLTLTLTPARHLPAQWVS